MRTPVPSPLHSEARSGRSRALGQLRVLPGPSWGLGGIGSDSCWRDPCYTGLRRGSSGEDEPPPLSKYRSGSRRGRGWRVPRSAHRVCIFTGDFLGAPGNDHLGGACSQQGRHRGLEGPWPERSINNTRLVLGSLGSRSLPFSHKGRPPSLQRSDQVADSALRSNSCYVDPCYTGLRRGSAWWSSRRG